jgi:predicted kinase
LRLGRAVIADCVNPLRITRDAWQDVANAAGCPVLAIEVICSDVAVHRRRIETRTIDIEGLKPPSWQDIVDREYEPWDRPRLILDTARLTPAMALAELHSTLDTIVAEASRGS